MSSPSTIAEAPLQHVTATSGTRYAYRRFGVVGEVPVVFLQHFRGNIDSWDPALVDAIAAHREVILVDNAGVGGSTGVSPETAEGMAETAAEFIAALDLSTVDLFGFSLGGFVAQALALAHPELVRRIVLASTGPKGAPGMEAWTEDVVGRLVTKDAPGGEDLLAVFYAPTGTSQSAGGASLGRIFGRQEGRDAEVSLETRDIQYHRAVLSWGRRDWAAVEALSTLAQPTLVLQGDDDVMIPTRASHTLAGVIPNSRLVIFPDASHGAIFQYAEQAAAEVVAFLG